MPLSAAKVKNAEVREKQYKLSDEKGMYLLVTPKGSKYWRLKYRYDGKEKTLALGVYPDTSLADARARRDDARKLLTNEVDPSEAKKARKSIRAQQADDSFQAIATEWFQLRSNRRVASVRA